TFLLVAALTLTAWWATHEAPPRLRDAGSLAVVLGLAVAGMLVLGVSGAITALGDTLFPVTTLAEGEALTFSGAAHVFVRLRLWHPVLACVAGALIVTAALPAATPRPEPTGAPGAPPARRR